MLYSHIVLPISLSLLLGTIVAFTGTASAAPQILALVVSNGKALPMNCAGGQYQTKVSSFYLQQTHPTLVRRTAGLRRTT